MQAGGGRRVAVIYFRHGSAKLQARDRTVLRDVVELYERRDRDLRVVGHASSRTAAMDPIAHRMANFDTSLARAQAVVDALVSLGVPRGDIQLEARGDNEPVYHEFMPTGEAGNRRTEIFLQG
jgi:flagellar motor protein MotB